MMAPWRSAGYRGLIWMLSQERLTTQAKVESELDRCDREAGGGDLPRVSHGGDSPCVWLSSLSDLCSFHFAGRAPD